jgi:hypothetical protein
VVEREVQEQDVDHRLAQDAPLPAGGMADDVLDERFVGN